MKVIFDKCKICLNQGKKIKCECIIVESHWGIKYNRENLKHRSLVWREWTRWCFCTIYLRLYLRATFAHVIHATYEAPLPLSVMEIQRKNWMTNNGPSLARLWQQCECSERRSDGRLSVLQFALLFRLSYTSYVHSRIFMYTFAVCHFSILDIHRQYIDPSTRARVVIKVKLYRIHKATDNRFQILLTDLSITTPATV